MQQAEVDEGPGQEGQSPEVAPPVPEADREQAEDRQRHGRRGEVDGPRPDRVGVRPGAPEPPELDQGQARHPAGMVAGEGDRATPEDGVLLDLAERPDVRGVGEVHLAGARRLRADPVIKAGADPEGGRHEPGRRPRAFLAHHGAIVAAVASATTSAPPDRPAPLASAHPDDPRGQDRRDEQGPRRPGQDRRPHRQPGPDRHRLRPPRPRPILARPEGRQPPEPGDHQGEEKSLREHERRHSHDERVRRRHRRRDPGDRVPLAFSQSPPGEPGQEPDRQDSQDRLDRPDSWEADAQGRPARRQEERIARRPEGVVRRTPLVDLERLARDDGPGQLPVDVGVGEDAGLAASLDVPGDQARRDQPQPQRHQEDQRQGRRPARPSAIADALGHVRRPPSFERRWGISGGCPSRREPDGTSTIPDGQAGKRGRLPRGCTPASALLSRGSKSSIGEPVDSVVDCDYTAV